MVGAVGERPVRSRDSRESSGGIRVPRYRAGFTDSRESVSTFLYYRARVTGVLHGTEQEVLQLLLESERTPTEVAAALGVSVQTASRNLKDLVERGYARLVTDPERRRRGREGRRGYKLYEAREFAHLFAAYGDELVDRPLDLTADKRAVLSAWTVPQADFHPVLLSYLFSPPDEDRYGEIEALAVYGSVARGEAKPDSDVDVLVVCDDSVDTDETGATTTRRSAGTGEFRTARVISEQWFTRREFENGLEAGSQFLHDVLPEAIVLYDPDDVIRDARQETGTGERVPGRS